MQRRTVLVLLTTTLCIIATSVDASEANRQGANVASSAHFIQKSDRLEAIKRYILGRLNVSDNRRFNGSTSDPTSHRPAHSQHARGQRPQLESTQSFSSLPEAMDFYAKELARNRTTGVPAKLPGTDGVQRRRRRLQRVDEAGRTELKKRRAGRRRSSRRRHQRRQIKLKLTPDAGVNSTGHDEIQFTLKDTGGQRRRRRHLEVTMATLNVPLGPRQTSHSRRSLDGQTSGGRHRLGIMVYAGEESSQVNESLPDSRWSSTGSAADNTSTPLAVLQLTGSSSNRRLSWQRLLLPTTYIQDALDAHDGVVRLRIVCDGCDSVGRRLFVEPEGDATSSVSAADIRANKLPTPYLEVVAKRRRSQRRRRHRLCPATVGNMADSRLATIIRRRC